MYLQLETTPKFQHCTEECETNIILVDEDKGKKLTAYKWGEK